MYIACAYNKHTCDHTHNLDFYDADKDLDFASFHFQGHVIQCAIGTPEQSVQVHHIHSILCLHLHAHALLGHHPWNYEKALHANHFFLYDTQFSQTLMLTQNLDNAIKKKAQGQMLSMDSKHRD